MAMGRPQKPHQTSWGECISGLYHCPDGRWRINSTGKKYTEPDERRAVQKFLDWKAMEGEGVIHIPTDSTKPIDPVATVNGVSSSTDSATLLMDLMIDPSTLLAMGKKWKPGAKVKMSLPIPERQFWNKVREFFLNDSSYVAKMTSLPELAGWRHFNIPRELSIATVEENYLTHCPIEEKSKREALAVWHRLVAHCEAKTLDDLTQAKLIAFKEVIENDPALASAGTRKGYYGRIKSVISFGLKMGLPAIPIREALDRCKVLWTGEKLPACDPTPISREDFHLLLQADENWRVWLLVGLNLCMHLGEVCGLEWKDFDLDKGVYSAIRKKTEKQKIPRAAVLWQETIQALQKLKRKGNYVFISKNGTRYNRNTRTNKFRKLCLRVFGEKSPINFEWIRDGGYTAAFGAGERYARILSGQRSPGDLDKYVLRDPTIVKPACEAVYRAYAPFP